MAFCPGCGEKIENEVQFCSKCGKAVGGTSVANIRQGTKNNYDLYLLKQPSAVFLLSLNG
jgi:uncharacterized membrane protein YvbJ